MSRLSALLGVAAVVLVALATACGDDDGGSAASVTTGVPLTAAPPVTLPVPVPADPTIIPLSDRLESRFDILGGPGWLAAGAGSLWVKRDHGSVVRIDPETNEIVAEIEVYESGLCQGIGADDEAVWTCRERDLVRIDPSTNEIAATIPIDKIADQGHLPVVDGRVWVLTGDGSTLVGVADDAVQTEIDLDGVHCTDLAPLDHDLWAVCLSDDAVVRIDLSSGEVTDRVEVPGPSSVAAAPRRVWVSYQGGVVAIDPETAEVLGTVDAPAGNGSSMAADEDALWSRSGAFLRRVDAETLAVTEEITAPETGPGEALIAFGSVWASAYDDAVVYRVSLD